MSIRIFCIALLLAVLAPAVHAKPGPGGKVEALEDADHGRWPEAEDAAARSGNPILVKLVQWLDYSRPGTDAGFERISAFIKANPDWPGMGSLSKRAEDSLPPTLPPAEIAAWFGEHPPANPDSLPVYYDALQRLGKQADANRIVQNFWIYGTFSNDQLRDYTARFGNILTRETHYQRTDRLIWEKAYLDARAMLPLLDRDDQAAANARIVLATDAPGMEAAVAEVPGDRQRDPGLLFARIKYAMSDLRDDEAAKLFAKVPADAPHQDAWSTERLILARRMIESHDYETAYAIASGDKATEPSQIAEAQFLAGWIALRFLNDPSRALPHFQDMYDHVITPVSKARAAYWASQTQAALGDNEQANEWLRRSARHSTTFYGQLAAEKLHIPLSLPPEPAVSAAQAAEFEHNDLVRAARLLHEADDENRVNQFLTKLGELGKTPAQQVQVVRLARELGIVPLSVQLAKRALQNNICVLASGYPVLSGVRIHDPEPALVHGIIRQESLFNPVIVSPAGAIGLMQLMPATAASEARKLGIRSTTAMLSQNPAENVQLGSGYLSDMIANFGGSYILAIASYNAGPGHVHNWLQDNGDPRHGDIDPIDWIELIPISETRNYVQRVLENTQIYRSRLAGGAVPVKLLEDLRR